MTPEYPASVQESVRQTPVCRVVVELVPITQKHDIEGLEMGAP
ncbi:hypothetical protein BH20CHL6_BH20CHL6_14300 [soil metagenome]